MKRSTQILTALSLVFSTLIIILAAGCINGLTCEKGNGKIKTEERKIAAFNAIEVSGAYNIVLKQDSFTSVSVEADENLQPLIITKLEGNKLVIKNNKSICSSKELKINITNPDIKNISMSGAVDLKTTNTFKSRELTIDVSGMADMTLDLNVQNLDISCSGSCDLNLKGSAENVKADLSGAADIKAFDLVTKKFKLSSSGAGSANVNVSEKLDVEISGAASVNYKGNPSVSQSISGAGTIHKEN
jgi:hypothetical protein